MPSKEGTLIRKIFSTSHRILLNQLLRVHTKGVEGKVLIVGAGHLDYSKFFESEKCTILHADLERFGCHIDFVVDAHELSSIGSQFDYIYMLEVVEHVEDPDTVFAECLACLKEQGKLVVSVPFMFHIHADPYDFWRYTDLGLKRK